MFPRVLEGVGRVVAEGLMGSRCSPLLFGLYMIYKYNPQIENSRDFFLNRICSRPKARPVCLLFRCSPLPHFYSLILHDPFVLF